MKVEITEQQHKNPGIRVEGPQVTDLVWGIFNYSIISTRYECPWHKARQFSGAAFTEGAGENTGKLFIELWYPSQGHKYLNLINRALAFVDDNGKPVAVKACIADMEKRKFVAGLTTYYDCEVTYENKVAIFTPKSAAMIATLVEKNIEWGNTFNPATLPVSPSDLVWGLYQDLGQNGSDYISDKDKRKQLVNDLRSVADQLQLTLKD